MDRKKMLSSSAMMASGQMPKDEKGEIVTPPAPRGRVTGKKAEVTVIRINPITHNIAALRKVFPSDVTRDLKVLCKAKEIQAKMLMPIEGIGLVSIAAVDVDEGGPMWRLKGGEDTAGIGVLIGQNGTGGGMCDVPVDVDWVKRFIVWTAPETAEQFEQRAQTILASMDTALLEILLAAEDHGPLADGDTTWWLQQSAIEQAAPMRLLGITDEPSAGQRLTKIGLRVKELAEGANN